MSLTAENKPQSDSTGAEISAFERVLLFFNATIAKMTSVLMFTKSSYNARFAGIFILMASVILYWKFPGSSLNNGFLGKRIIVFYFVPYCILELFFKRKIDVLWQNYYRYYNKYLLFVFILFYIGCLGFVIYKIC